MAANEIVADNSIGKIFIALWLAAAFMLLSRVLPAHGDEWVFYASSGQKVDLGRAVRDYYVLNRLPPLDNSKSETTRHFYDRDSLGYNSPFGGGTVRVWEKAVIKKETPSYERAREMVQNEERKRLNRELTVLDTSWILNMAANRAAKEITTYYEINCDTEEFFVLEVNTYDKNGLRMTREVISNKYLWSQVAPGTLMGILARKLCDAPPNDQ